MLSPSRPAAGIKRRGMNPDPAQEIGVLPDDPLVVALAVIDQIHLVDHHGDLFDAEHGHHVAVAAGILLNSLLGIDDQEGSLGTGGASDHVLQELDVPWRIDDDVVALGRLEEDPCCVDRDALRLLVLQRVEKEGVFERLGGALAKRLDRLELPSGSE